MRPAADDEEATKYRDGQMWLKLRHSEPVGVHSQGKEDMREDKELVGQPREPSLDGESSKERLSWCEKIRARLERAAWSD